MVTGPVRVGIAFPFAPDEVDGLRRLAPGLEIRSTPATDQAAIDDLARDDLDGLIGQSLPSDRGRTPSLRWLQVLSAGVDGLTDPAAGPWPAGIELTNARGVYAGRIGQYHLGAILRIAEHHDARRAQQATADWPEDATPLIGIPLRHLTLLIVGYGGIGREIARLAAAHGMRILAVKADPARREDDGFRMPGTGDPDGTLPERIAGLEGLAAAAREADIVSVTLPLTSATRGLVSSEVLAALPSHAWVINTGRGPVIDEAALADAVAGGRLGGAVLDVFGEEPLPRTSGWWGQSRVVVTPHVSGAGAHEELLALVTENIGRFANGEPLRNRVDPARGY